LTFDRDFDTRSAALSTFKYITSMSATRGKVSSNLPQDGEGADEQTALALTRVWHHASAQDRVLGNLASRIAWVLMGKHKPTYDPAGKSLALFRFYNTYGDRGKN
jgi:hypothetical protein